MQMHELSLVDPIPKLETYREQDSLIMNDAIESGFCGDELTKIYKCRMWLQITCKSELCDVSGLQIIPEEQWPDISSLFKAKWPRREIELSNLHWDLWKNFLGKNT